VAHKARQCRGEQLRDVAAARADLARHVLDPAENDSSAPFQLMQQPVSVPVRDQLRCYHQERERGPLSEAEYKLLDIGCSRRQVHYQAVDLIPASAGDEPVNQQLGQGRRKAQTLTLAYQEGSRGNLHPVPLSRL
jgi:hypothetical protein